MNQFYNENTINEDLERELYYTIRDAISQARNAPLPISLAGIATAIADEIEGPQTLNKLLAELDEQLTMKLNNQPIEPLGIFKTMEKQNDLFFEGLNKAFGI